MTAPTNSNNTVDKDMSMEQPINTDDLENKQKDDAKIETKIDTEIETKTDAAIKEKEIKEKPIDDDYVVPTIQYVHIYIVYIYILFENIYIYVSNNQ